MIDRNLHPHEVNLIEKRISGFFDGYRQNIALLGKERDKIMDVLTKCLIAHKNHSTIHICVNASYLDSKEFFKSAAYSILNQYLFRQDMLDALINFAEDILPCTTSYIKKILSEKHVPFLAVVELINKFINESKKKCIWIIDDFTSLKDIFPNFNKPFVQFIILQKKCMIILTSPKIKESEKILGTELNLLFGSFELISLDESTLFHNYLYFGDLLKPLAPPPYIAAFFINLFRSRCLYYQILNREIKNVHTNDCWDDTAFHALERVLYNKNTVLFQKFIDKIELLRARYKDHRLLIKFLLLISEGYTRKSDLMFFSGLDSRKFSTKMQHLIEIDYVQNLGNIYIISDSLFTFWLSVVFKKYISVHILDENKRAFLFKERIREEISLFKEDFYKEKAQRILELFASFKNDTLIIEKQKIRFPSLERIKIIAYPEKSMNLLVGEGDEIVFAGIKENITNQTDILDFISKTRALKAKNIRKIFISLGDLTPPAKFIAKQNKISLWDINGLNTLLRIYNKPVLL